MLLTRHCLVFILKAFSCKDQTLLLKQPNRVICISCCMQMHDFSYHTCKENQDELSLSLYLFLFFCGQSHGGRRFLRWMFILMQTSSECTGLCSRKPVAGIFWTQEELYRTRLTLKSMSIYSTTEPLLPTRINYVYTASIFIFHVFYIINLWGHWLFAWNLLVNNHMSDKVC